VPETQVTLHQVGGQNANTCNSTVKLASGGDLVPPSTATVNLKFITDAFPQPHEGDPIALTHSTLTVSIPADVIQAGVDAGIISDGQTLKSQASFVLAGSNTAEGTHTYNVPPQTVTIHVVGGKAQPLNPVIDLENTNWTPLNNTDPVAFTEKSLKIVSTINIGFDVISTFTCAPTGTAQFLALSASGPPPPPPVTDTVAAVTTTTTALGAQSTSSGSGSLPRTGAETLLLLVLAAFAIDVGIVMIGATRRRMHHR
jgi:hypothetical protein